MVHYISDYFLSNSAKLLSVNQFKLLLSLLKMCSCAIFYILKYLQVNTSVYYAFKKYIPSSYLVFSNLALPDKFKYKVCWKTEVRQS